MQDNETRFKNMGTLFTIAGGMSFLSSIFSGFKTRTLIVSDLLFFVGVFLILGPTKFLQFVISKKRMYGSITIFIGIVLVLFKRNVFGGIIQLLGIFLMFGGFLPKLITVLRNTPVIGKYFRFALPSWLYRNNEDLQI